MAVLSEILAYFISFNISLSVFSAAFLCQFKLRKNRWWILLVGGAIFLFLPLTYKLLAHNSFYTAFFFKIGWYSVSYLLLCAVLFLICYFSFQVSVKELLLIICCSYLFQNIIYNIYWMLVRGIPDINTDILKTISVVLNFALSIGMCFLFKKRIIRFDISKVKLSVVSGISISLIIIITVLSQWVGSSSSDENNYKIAVSIYAAIVSILLLCILIGVFNNSWLLHENAIINELFCKAEKQYRVSRDNVEYINSRVHDLKHQIAAMKQLVGQGGQRLDFREKIAELEKVVEVYDDTVLTGNNVLDTLLTEEKTLCKKNQIHLEHMVDGSVLNFIDPVDLYVLFGNALDNAIEGVLKIDDVEKRIISIAVEKRSKFVNITIENFFTGTLVLHNGLPRTSKQEESFHGFGIKSIKYIAQKYGGNVTISAENNQFSLAILIPLNKSDNNEDN